MSSSVSSHMILNDAGLRPPIKTLSRHGSVQCRPSRATNGFPQRWRLPSSVHEASWLVASEAVVFLTACATVASRHHKQRRRKGGMRSWRGCSVPVSRNALPGDGFWGRAGNELVTPRRLEIKEKDFMLNGEKHVIISGSMSYFRMLPDQWKDRLRKLRCLGCNAVEVYVPWNLHEPVEGQFLFDGRRDLPAFLKLCQAFGLDVLLRPGPYICAEWDFGGLPWWLMSRPDPVPLRSSDGDYLRSVEAWWSNLFPRLQDLLGCNGGPIIAVQIENEYGYWGDDTRYMERLKEMIQQGLGPECPLLFTSDGTFFPDLQSKGGVEGALKTANFGSDPRRRLEELRSAQPFGPLCNMEFWVGWFDAWGAVAGKSYRAPEDVARTLRETLELGASVNFFVFHGGTSFGLCGAGANLEANRYEPQVTSYDYGGLLDEAGEVTEKYIQCRQVISDFLNKPELLEFDFPRGRRLASPPLDLESSVTLGEALPFLQKTPVRSVNPLNAEELQCGYGYVLYRTLAAQCSERSPMMQRLPLRLGDNAVRDFASVMVDGQVLGTVYRNDAGPGVREFQLPDDGKNLDILVEVMNRVNFGPGMRGERKGLVGYGSVQVGSMLQGPARAVVDWECIPIPMAEDDLAKLQWSGGSNVDGRNGSWSRGPRFFLFALYVREPADGFLVLDGMRKGFACVNGFNLGRYWDVGPQRSLYLPAGLLKQGRNEVIIFDIDNPGGEAPSVRVVEDAVWTSGLMPKGLKETVTDVTARTVASVEDAFRIREVVTDATARTVASVEDAFKALRQDN